MPTSLPPQQLDGRTLIQRLARLCAGGQGLGDYGITDPPEREHAAAKPYQHYHFTT